MIVLAVIFFVIIFIIAIIALAMFNKDHRKGYDGNIGETLATVIAAKGVGNCSDGYKYDHEDHSHIEIKDMISHSEDRRDINQIKSEIGALGMFTQKTAADNELLTIREIGELKAAQSMTNQALAQVLQVQNNNAIVSEVINRLTYRPCAI